MSSPIEYDIDLPSPLTKQKETFKSNLISEYSKKDYEIETCMSTLFDQKTIVSQREEVSR